MTLQTQERCPHGAMYSRQQARADARRMCDFVYIGPDGPSATRTMDELRREIEIKRTIRARSARPLHLRGMGMPGGDVLDPYVTCGDPVGDILNDIFCGSWSNRFLAEEFQCSESAVSRYRCGHGKPSAETLENVIYFWDTYVK